jgi:glutamyl endopeptidase
VPDPSTVPWRSICWLIIKRENGAESLGTGWLAGPSLLVTAGHCLFDPENGGHASTVTAIPASNGTHAPYGTWQGTHMETHPAWMASQDPRHDYGFLDLAVSQNGGQLGQQVGWFGFSVLEDDQIKNLLVNIAGYPANKASGTMWYNADRLVGGDTNFLNYMLETEAGESGGPVFWLGPNGQRIVVATHAYHTGTGNMGLRVTPEMYSEINRLNQLGSG